MDISSVLDTAKNIYHKDNQSRILLEADKWRRSGQYFTKHGVRRIRIKGGTSEQVEEFVKKASAKLFDRLPVSIRNEYIHRAYQVLQALPHQELTA
jgi:hypothetical protein